MRRITRQPKCSDNSVLHFGYSVLTLTYSVLQCNSVLGIQFQGVEQFVEQFEELLELFELRY